MLGIKKAKKGGGKKKDDGEDNEKEKEEKKKVEAKQDAEVKAAEDGGRKFVPQRQRGQVIRDEPVDIPQSMKDNLEENYHSWRTCRGCCRLSLLCCKRRMRGCSEALQNKFVEEFEGLGVEKTPTFKRLARFSRWSQMSHQTMRANLRQHALSYKIKLFGPPKVEYGIHRKHKFSSHRIIQKPAASDGFSLASLVIHNDGLVFDYFIWDEHDLDCHIGAGGSSTVFKAIERMTHIPRAVKRINKKDVGEEEILRNEVRIMKKLDHPNIPKLYEIFEDDKHVYLIMELCAGGDLLDKLLESSHMGEPQAGVVARTMIQTCNYLHSYEVMHRDIKPENILFQEELKAARFGHEDEAEIQGSSIRVVDFGFSRIFSDPNELMYTKVGSPYYIAPEVLNGQGYTKQADLWSIGAVIYMLLCGYPPFAGNTDADTLALVKTGRYVFPTEQWKVVSRGAKHLISHLMDVEPDRRITLRKALEHPWIRAKGMGKLEKFSEATVDKLVTFHKHHSLRKAAMLAIGYQLEAHHLANLRDLYQSMDLNGDGLLQRNEFMKALMSVGVDEVFVQEMIKSVDADGSGIIDYTEFIAATLEKDTYIKNHAACLRAFRCFDQDDSGALSLDEIQEILDMKSQFQIEEAQHFFDEIDDDKNGFMDYGEFHAMLEVEIEAVRAHIQPNDADVHEDTSEEALDEEFDTHIKGHDKELLVRDDEVIKKKKDPKHDKHHKGKHGRKSKTSEEGPAQESLGIEGDLCEAEIAAEKEAERDLEEADERKALADAKVIADKKASIQKQAAAVAALARGKAKMNAIGYNG